MQLLELDPDLLREVCLGHYAKVAEMLDALDDMNIDGMGLGVFPYCRYSLFCRHVSQCSVVIEKLIWNNS